MDKKIFFNGTILTMDDEKKKVDNFLAEDGTIVKTGLSEGELARLEGAEWIDLSGKTCIPGFHDSHMHMIEYGYNRKYCVDLSEADSVEDMIDRMRRFIEENKIPENSWEMGMRWNQENFADKKMPDRKDLDRVSDKHFVFAKRVCIHIAAANSRLLDLCGINEETYPGDPNIGRFPDGTPDGRIYEDAISGIVLAEKPPLTVEEIEAIISDTAKEIRESGFTSVQTDDMKAFSDFQSKKNILKAYDNLRNRGKLPIRIFEQIQVSSMEELRHILKELREIRADEMFSFDRLKLILDGSLGASTAAMGAPYKGTEDQYGLLNFADEEMEELVSFAYAHRMQVMCHCIGDRAMEQAIRIIGKYQEKFDDDRRPRIVHCQICTEHQLEEMSRLRILADIQPAFVPTDYIIIEKQLEHPENYCLYPWKTMKEHGITVSGSSDAPVEGYDALYGIQAAVTRADISGIPQGGWLPEEKLTAEEALKLYTSQPAYTVFQENHLGKIAEGYKADIAVLTENPLAVNPQRIHTIKAEASYVGGKRG